MQKSANFEDGAPERLDYRIPVHFHVIKTLSPQSHSHSIIHIFHLASTSKGCHRSPTVTLSFTYLIQLFWCHGINKCHSIHCHKIHKCHSIYLWHKGLLPKLFQDFFQYAGNVHGYNTRYASRKNLYISKVRTNSGKQSITYTATVLWDNIPIHLKELNVFNFSKQLKHLLSEQHCENL